MTTRDPNPPPGFRFIWVIVLALIPGGLLFVFDQAMGVFAVAGGCSSRFNMQIQGLGDNSYRASSPDARAN